MSKTTNIHIVLIAPQIPANTGNIIRLCANTGAFLHLVEPIAFDLEDKKLRRAGLDYHEYAPVRTYQNWQACKTYLMSQNIHTIVALTTKKSRPFYAYDFAAKTQSVALVFGSETCGLDETIREDIGAPHWLRLPMLENSRSLNLSNAVAVCLYEVWRQMDFVGDIGYSVGYHTPNQPRTHRP